MFIKNASLEYSMELLVGIQVQSLLACVAWVLLELKEEQHTCHVQTATPTKRYEPRICIQPHQCARDIVPGSAKRLSGSVLLSLQTPNKSYLSLWCRLLFAHPLVLATSWIWAQRTMVHNILSFPMLLLYPVL